jgi:hypothetical protein
MRIFPAVPLPLEFSPNLAIKELILKRLRSLRSFKS